MKIILSRKGFDSSYGGAASPILPDEAMFSLPIPERPGMAHAKTRTYGQIRTGAWTAGQLAADLTAGRVGSADFAHLDPDLDRVSVRPRPRGWRAAFGQTGAAETHLQNQGIGPGDVFLFFGWFREVARTAGRWRYRADAPDRHVCFGWLQVAARLPVVPLAGLPRWLAGHPHYKTTPYGRADSVYVAAESLRLPGVADGWPGGGVFGTYRPALCLTAEGRTRSQWRLPAWFHPVEGRLGLSYHRDLRVWTPYEDHVLLDTAKQGQEFVLDTQHYPEAPAWLAGLFAGQPNDYQRTGTP